MTTKERPIIFRGDMVRAILDGRKTQTRRVVKAARDRNGSGCELAPCEIAGEVNGADPDYSFCPYGQPGDRLWVRESFCEALSNYEEEREQTTVYYRADGQEVVVDDGDGYAETNKDGTLKSPWKPSIHMPRWASRITLEITDIRVERLQDISEDDADSECFGGDIPGNIFPDLFPGNFDAWGHLSIPECFGRVWDAINGQGSWSANPWVWVLEFKRLAP